VYEKVNKGAEALIYQEIINMNDETFEDFEISKEIDIKTTKLSVYDVITLERKKKKNEYNKRYYEKNKEEIAKRAKEYYYKNKEERIAYNKKYYENNKEKISKQKREYQKEYRQRPEVKKQRRKSDKRYREKNKEELSRKQKIWAKNNRDKLALSYKRLRIKRKIEWVTMLGGKCERCGFNDIRALHFHHKTPEDKENTIEWYRKKFRIKIEEGKIELMCSNCHLIEHSTDIYDEYRLNPDRLSSGTSTNPTLNQIHKTMK